MAVQKQARARFDPGLEFASSCRCVCGYIKKHIFNKQTCIHTHMHLITKTNTSMGKVE